MPNVTKEEVEKLSISMALKLATYQLPFSGAKCGISNEPYDQKVLEEFVGEIADFIKGANLGNIKMKACTGYPNDVFIQLVTGPDMGTSEEGYLDALRVNGMGNIARKGLLSQISEKFELPLDNILTGYGIVVAAEETFKTLNATQKEVDPLDGINYSIEGFGKVGSGIAKLLKGRAKLKAFSNRFGTVVAKKNSEYCTDEGYFDIDKIMPLFLEKGDHFIYDLDIELLDTDALFDVTVDLLVPGTRVERIDQEIAERIVKARTKIIVPAANYPFSFEGRKVLEENGVTVIPDFLANAGAVIAAMLEFTTKSFNASLEKVAMDLVHAAVSNEIKELFLDGIACGCRIGEKVMQTEKSLYDISIERSISKLKFMEETIDREQATNLKWIADEFIERTLLGSFM